MRTLLVIIVLGLSSMGLAAVTIQCDVQVRGRVGYERAVRRDVQFAKGSELGFGYRSSKLHALLWFSQTQVAVLEHTGTLFGSFGDLTARDIENLFMIRGSADFVQVNGTSDTEYRVTCKQFGRWIDNRM